MHEELIRSFATSVVSDPEISPDYGFNIFSVVVKYFGAFFLINVKNINRVVYPHMMVLSKVMLLFEKIDGKLF